MADLLALKMEAATVEELRTVCRTQQDRLFGLEKADAQAQLAAGVAHDFRNLLTVIVGHAEMLGARTDLPADILPQLQAMVEAAARGTDLVQELLEFARPNGRPPVALHMEKRRRVPPVLKAPRIQAPAEYAPRRSRRALINKTDYCRILLNLVSNAGDAARPAGR